MISKCSAPQHCRILDLDDALLQYILSFCNPVSDWIKLMTVSSTFKETLLRLHLWSESAINLCLVDSCVECGSVKSSFYLAAQICEKSNLKVCRIHIPVFMLTSLLINCRLSSYLKEISLRVHDSTPHQHLIKDVIEQGDNDELVCLESLVIIGWSDVFISPLVEKRVRQLQRSLRILKLRSSFPATILHFVANCESLEVLELSGLVGLPLILDSSLCVSNLKCLIINDTNIRIGGPIVCGVLSHLEYYCSSNFEFRALDDIETMLSFLPRSMQELKFSCCIGDVSKCLDCVACNCPNLRALSVTQRVGSLQELPAMDINAISLLTSKCKKIECFELGGAGFCSMDVKTFKALAQFENLQRIRLPVDGDLINQLADFLGNAKKIEEITFYGSSGGTQSEIPQHSWMRFEESLQLCANRFPSVHISLIDQWWS